MSWLALNTQPGMVDANPKFPADSMDALLVSGSLIFEIDFAANGKTPCRLVHFEDDSQWIRRFTLYLNADHSLSIEVQQGPATSYIFLDKIDLQILGLARLTYSWNAPARVGLVSLENLATGDIRQETFQTSVPIPLGDVDKIVMDHRSTVLDPRVVLLAASDRIEPVGPSPTILAGAMVETPRGARPIDRLQLGDMVITQSGQPSPVRWILKRELPASGVAAPVRLHAPFFGLEHDILIAPKQRVMIAGVETEYAFGKDAVLLQARDLIGHPGATIQRGMKTAMYYQILLDRHECINLSGTWADSLHIGTLARSPELLVTTDLAEVPATALPIHTELVHPTLRPFETRVLLDTLIA